MEFFTNFLTVRRHRYEKAGQVCTGDRCHAAQPLRIKRQKQGDCERHRDLSVMPVQACRLLQSPASQEGPTQTHGDEANDHAPQNPGQAIP